MDIAKLLLLRLYYKEEQNQLITNLNLMIRTT